MKTRGMFLWDERPHDIYSPLIWILVLTFLTPFLIIDGRSHEVEEDSSHITNIPLGSKAIVTLDTNYRILLFLAQEEAKCLLNYGSRVREDNMDKIDKMDQIKFTNFRCVKNSTTFSQCQQCRNMTETLPTIGRCEAICLSLSDTACSEKCLWIQGEGEKLKSVNEEMNEERSNSIREIPGISVQSPELFCEDMSKPQTLPEFHVVVVQWTVNLTTNAVSNDTDLVTTVPPIVFVLQRMDVMAAEPQWETRWKTLSLIQPVSSPYSQRTFRYRVIAVGPEGPIGQATSPDISTHNGFVEAGPPKRIYKIKEVVYDNSLDVLIGWDPPDDKPCDYKVVQNRQDGEGKSVYHRFNATDLEDGLRVWFYDLKFKKTYDIRITSRRASWEGFESEHKSQTFTMPSCLDAHQYRFDKCVPSPPRNLRQDDVVVTEEEDDEGRGDIKVKWDVPLHTSEQNKLKSYSLFVGSPFHAKGHNDTIFTHPAFQLAAPTGSQVFSISQNVTEYVIQNVTLNRGYHIALLATSVKGDSPPVYFTLNTFAVNSEDSVSFLGRSWVYLSIPISLMVLGIFGCHFLRVLVQKRQVKKARDQYFQSMDERDAISVDWSIVPLNDNFPNMKYMSEGPKEKWEISYDDLIMGDVIGQGAFGVVRRAKMARRKHHVLGNQKYSAFETPILDENGMETVAVKMLKVSATRDDRDQLIKEIVTMQNLGGHQQIVSLLGACTKGRSLCLVLEFCPGGDLLSFLRKVRAKYWPTLGLTDQKRSNSDTSLDKVLRQTTSIESGCTSRETYNSSHRKNSDSSPINYADIGDSTELSKSLDRLSTPNTVINHQYGRIPTDENGKMNFEAEEDDCRPIDEKDILSYARQIAMGMEYLEKNRVVHRDLAGRNVLLLGDYKQVKISDFGLSRDIYTWNVYHQKSNGKLPIKWMAIESIFTHVFTSKSDVWSFGILLWELVTLGGTPYPGLGNTELFNLLKSGYRMERPDNCSEELYALMKKCWRTSPVSRPNFTELRRYLETMLEAAEPSLYLSLMADIPVDYFHLSSRSDLLHLKLDDDSPLHENAVGVSNSSTFKQYNTGSSNSTLVNNVRKPRQNCHTNQLASPKHPNETSSSRDGALLSLTDTHPLVVSHPSCEGKFSDEVHVKLEPDSAHPLLDDSNQHRGHGSSASNRSHSTSWRSRSIKSAQSIHMTPSVGRSLESLVSPDSGITRSEAGYRETEDTWSDNEEDHSSLITKRSLSIDQKLEDCNLLIPLKHLNGIKITEGV